MPDVPVLSTRAQGLDDQYVQIYNQIQQADGYLKLGQKGQAAILYQEALVGLKRIKTMAPNGTTGSSRSALITSSEKLAELRHEPRRRHHRRGPTRARRGGLGRPGPRLLAERVRALEAQRAELAAS